MTPRGASVPGSPFPVPSIPDSLFPIPDPAYGALVASQFALPMTESGFEASMMAVVPTSFPSFIRPTARNVTFGVPFGRLGSLYGFDVEIMLSASSFVVMATVTVGFPNVMVAVVSEVLLTVKVVVVSLPSRFDVPFHVPVMSAAVSAGGGGGGGGGAGVVVSGAGSFLAHAATNRASRNTLRIDASMGDDRIRRVTRESSATHAPSIMHHQAVVRQRRCRLPNSAVRRVRATHSWRSTATGSMRAARHAGIQLAAIDTTPSVTAVPT